MSTAPTRTLIVGSGAREHALAWKLAGEPGMNTVYVTPGSAAIDAEPLVSSIPGIDPLDPAAVLAAARGVAAELVVVGPEAPLAAGVADALRNAGIAVFGPSRAAAQIECSKAFCHEVATAAGIRMAAARAFGPGEAAAAHAHVDDLGADGNGVVLKQDGLAAGKGVVVYDAGEIESAHEQLAAWLDPRTADGGVVVVEERLRGREASVIAICDGRMSVALPAARDHKRLRDADAGPNTGGMGAYSPLPDLPDELVREVVRSVHEPVLAELASRGTPFIGFLYAGLMLTDAGPVLLECNARLGDPEAQVILPRIAVAIGPIMAAAARGSLGVAPGTASGVLPVFPGAAVGIVLASEGYPGSPLVGRRISGLGAAADAGALLFHAATVRRPDGHYATAGGRVLTVVGRGADLGSARAAAESAADAIAWDGLQRRHDIAADPPLAPASLVEAAS
jgi:phosphoribosylamine--glycine ligase